MTIDRIATYDIETLKTMFLIVIYDHQTEEWHQYGVWRGHNSLDKMFKHFERLKMEKYWMVGYNSISFDAQIVEFILRNLHTLWIHKTGEEIIELIYNFSQNVIRDNNADLYPPFRESSLYLPQIDVMRIHHYDNVNKKTSLKWLEYMMDMPSIEDMPISHDVEYMSDEEIEETIGYCRNDVVSTIRFYKYTIGEVEHEFYKGNNKIEDRLAIINELGFPPETISYSDVKMGDELNKRGYSKATGKIDRQIYELKRNRRPTKKFTFRDCVPEYVRFTSPAFQQIAEDVFVETYKEDGKDKHRERKVKLNGEEQEVEVTYNETKYTIARGGIHSNEKYRIIIPSPGQILMDADIGSQYPNAIAKRELFPSHLGPAWNRVYKETITKRLSYKTKAKDQTLTEVERKKYKGLAETYKLALNGGGFGKTNERTNWQYDPFVQFRCTIGNEFEILMLIEMLELSDIHCVSANTDGIVCLFDRHLLGKYYEICHEWEVLVGNDINGKLEYQEYIKLVQESVNCYYAVKPDGKTKKKGRLDWESELNKNNSKDLSRIERKALHDFFTKDVPIETTIIQETNPYMFCIGKKATKNFNFEAIDRTGDMEEYTRVIRYIITGKGKSGIGHKLIKMKNQESDTNANKVNEQAKDYLVTVCNLIDESIPNHYLEMVHHGYYIEGAERVKELLLRKGNKKFKPQPKEQTSLF